MSAQLSSIDSASLTSNPSTPKGFSQQVSFPGTYYRRKSFRIARPEPASITHELPRDLVQAVAQGNARLFVGAGFSMQAGLPSAAAFADGIIQRLNEIDPGYRPAVSGTLLNAVASDL